MTRATGDPARLFSSKAALYDKYRWDYAPKAVEVVLSMSGVDKRSEIADLGSGTGILTWHFLDKVNSVYAVEPNSSMRQLAEENNRDSPSFSSLSNRAESTGLRTNSLDLVVVGQALHWFDANRAPAEIRRILKPDGWLAVFWNALGSGDLLDSLNSLSTTYHSGERRRTLRDLLPPYFHGMAFQEFAFRSEYKSDWDQFLGGSLTASWAPDRGDSHYQDFAEDLWGVFEKHRSDDTVDIEVITHLAIGQHKARISL